MRTPSRFDAVLVKLRFDPGSREQLWPRVLALADAWSADGSTVTAHANLALGELYVYRLFPAPLALSGADLGLAQSSAQRWTGAAAGQPRASRLQCVFDVALFERVRAMFDAQGLVDLLVTIASYNMVSRFLVAAGIRH